MRGFPTTCLLCWVLALGVSSSVWAQGYSIDRIANRVVVNTKNHWANWTFPKGTLEITDDGQVRPALIRKNINATLNASQFVHKGIRGGISDAGSNFQDAPNIIDGDVNTTWGPDPSDPLENWWVEIDLGRLVSATKILLRFAPEGQGDPFKQFVIYVSDGGTAFLGSDMLDYWVVGKTTKPNIKQRVFEFEPIPKERASITGAPVQYIQVVVTDSDFDKAEEISEEEYRALDRGERGAIEYFRRTSTGAEEPISKEGYELLDPDKRGSVRYYRREVPRLAEVEVWTVGENIGLGILDRGGNIDVTGVGRGLDAFDGELLTKWEAAVYSPARERGVMTVDLGTAFWVDTIRLIGKKTVEGRGDLRGYEMRGSDGSRAPDGTLIWEVLSPKEREQNLKREFLFEDVFSLRKLRFLDFKNLDITGVAAGGYGQFGSVNELQVFGQGYVPEVEMVSDLIELGGSRNLTSIEWAADVPPKTRIEIQTRTGDELREVKHFFNASGVEVSEREYNKLPGVVRGDIITEHLPGSDWSGWSQPYLQSGDRITSPSPRRYAKIRVRLLSDASNIFPSLDSIVINFRRPVAKELVGEIFPDKGVPVGRSWDFEFFIKPVFLPMDPGFDEILIQSPSGARMELLGISLGREEDFLNFKTENFLPDAGGVFRNESGDVLEVVKDLSDSLWVRLPWVVKATSLDLIRVQFRSTIFINGTVFEASVANSSRVDSWQMVDPGDATLLTAGRSMTVFAPIGERIISDVGIGPNPFTPNGDGINDEVRFEFSVFKVNTDKPVGVTIYSLKGGVVRQLSERRSNASGRYLVSWAGEDEFGDTVPPGIYLVRFRIDADSESAQNNIVNRLVYVAY